MSPELLKPIDFTLDRGSFAVEAEPFQGSRALRNGRGRRCRVRRNLRDQLGVPCT